MQKLKAHPALRAEPPLFFFLMEKELGKEELVESRKSFELKRLNESINLVFFRQTGVLIPSIRLLINR